MRKRACIACQKVNLCNILFHCTRVLKLNFCVQITGILITKKYWCIWWIIGFCYFTQFYSVNLKSVCNSCCVRRRTQDAYLFHSVIMKSQLLCHVAICACYCYLKGTCIGFAALWQDITEFNCKILVVSGLVKWPDLFDMLKSSKHISNPQTNMLYTL